MFAGVQSFGFRQPDLGNIRQACTPQAMRTLLEVKAISTPELSTTVPSVAAFAGNEPARRYVRYLAIKASSDIAVSSTMHPAERRLLELFALEWHEGRALQVTRAMRLSGEMSSATVYRWLTSLRLQGLVELIPDEFDNRIKYVAMTHLSRDYFARQGRAVVGSSEQHV